MKESIVFLGGAASQTIAIERARNLGYRTVVCDMDPNVPGASIADVFHEVSTLDFDQLVEVVKSEAAAGVVAYATDRAAPTAARVAKACGLPGNDPDAVATFCDKAKFRGFLSRNGFAVPQSRVVRLNELDAVCDMRFPVIVKPTDSAGSRGISVVHDKTEIAKAFDFAASHSRNGKLIIEEYIVKDHPHSIGIEIYAVDGEVVTWGLMNCVRDSRTNDLVPAGESLPLELDGRREAVLRESVSRLVTLSGIKTSAFNMEAVFDARDRLFFLDVGPRSGGNMLPQFIQLASGADTITATIEAAVGKRPDINALRFNGTPPFAWGQAVLHATSKGCFNRVAYSDEANSCLIEEHLYVSPGDEVERFMSAGDALGIAFFRCQDLAQVLRILENDQIVVEVDNDQQ